MINPDDQLLSVPGLPNLPPEHRNLLLKAMYQELEIRVGTVIARQMTDRQLDEFETYVRNRDAAGAFAWLERTFPKYRDIVAGELEKLRNELKSSGAEVGALSTLYEI